MVHGVQFAHNLVVLIGFSSQLGYLGNIHTNRVFKVLHCVRSHLQMLKLLNFQNEESHKCKSLFISMYYDLKLKFFMFIEVLVTSCL